MGAVATESVGTLAGLINEYGMSTVLTAVFLFIFILVQVRMYRQNDERTKISNQIIQQSIQTSMQQNQKLLENFLARNSEKEESSLLEAYFSAKALMQEYCDVTRDVIDASHIGLYVFHNGSNSISGFPFFKFTCILESIAKGNGSIPREKDHAGLPISLLNSVINDLWSSGHAECFANSDDQDKVVIKQIFLQGDNQTGLLYTIYGSENKPIGFFFIEFADLCTMETLRAKKKELKKLSEKVSPVLSFSSYKRTAKL